MPSMQQNAAITFYAFSLFERLSLIDKTIKVVNSKIVHGFFSSDNCGNLTGLWHFLFAFSARFATNLNF